MSEIIAVRPDDYYRLSLFHSAFPEDLCSPEYWERRFRFWWDENPAFDEASHRGWMILDDAGAIGGFLGSIPSFFRVQGFDQRVFSATSWRVLQEHRSLSIRLYLEHIRAGGGSLLFNTTASPKTFRVMEYLKFHSVQSSFTGRTFIIAANPSAALAAYLRERSVPKLLRQAAGVALQLATLPLEFMLRDNSGAEVHILSNADESFDDLWQRTCHRYANTFVRSAAQVNWLCFSNPESLKVLIACYVAGRLRGFAIFAEAKRRGMRVLNLCDLWSEGADDRVTKSLVGGAWKYARSNGYDLIALHDYSPELARTFRRLGLFFTTSDTTRVFYRPPDSGAFDLEAGNAYLSSMEGDRML